VAGRCAGRDCALIRQLANSRNLSVKFPFEFQCLSFRIIEFYDPFNKMEKNLCIRYDKTRHDKIQCASK